jgi:hypothetical protein
VSRYSKWAGVGPNQTKVVEVFSRPTHPVGVAQGEGFFQTKPPLPKENLKLARSGMQVGPSSWESVHLQPVRAKKTQFTF